MLDQKWHLALLAHIFFKVLVHSRGLTLRKKPGPKIRSRRSYSAKEHFKMLGIVLHNLVTSHVMSHYKVASHLSKVAGKQCGQVAAQEDPSRRETNFVTPQEDKENR